MAIWFYAGFVLIILCLLILDLGLRNRRAHAIKIREALLWTSFYIALAMLFNVAVYFIYQRNWMGLKAEAGVSGSLAAFQFLMGYLLEESLRMDNLFVIALIFRYFRVPLAHQHRVLFWGILGALIMRGLMIA